MGEPHVISALVSKRAEVSGLLAEAVQRADRFRTDLAHLDATIRLFDPEIRPQAIRPKRAYQKDGWFGSGELPRLCLDILRRKQESMDTLAVAEEIATLKKVDTGDRRTMNLFISKAGKTMAALRSRGVLDSTRTGKTVEWYIPA